MPRQTIPNIDEIYRQDFLKVIVLKGRPLLFRRPPCTQLTISRELANKHFFEVSIKPLSEVFPVCENTTFKQIIRNLHKFVILIFFFKIVVLKAACDSKPVSNFSHLHQRSFSRKSRSQMFLKIVFPKNFANLTGKHQCWSLFLINFQALGL